MGRISIPAYLIPSVLFLPQLLVVAGFQHHGSDPTWRDQVLVQSGITNRRTSPRFSFAPRFQTKSGDDPKLQETDKAFWMRQRQLIQDLSDVSNKSLRAKQKEQFAKRRIALVGDTAFLSFFVFCGLWSAFENPFVALSYILGATLGLAYAYGLGKYVESIGGSVYDAEAGEGAGVGQARFAFLILLFVLVGKFKSAGLVPVVTIAGFFTYQITSLSQGLKEELDDDEQGN